MLRILVLAGSARRDSLNKKLARHAARVLDDSSTGIDARFLDLADFAMPLYDGDLESASGLPGNAKRLKAEFMASHGLLLACPEYNSSITPLLKNSLDWVSRQEDGEVPLAAYRGKTAALISASPGGLGGLRGLVHVRSILSNIGVLVLPEQLAIARAHDAFDPSGALVDPDQNEKLRSIATALAQLTHQRADVT